MRAAAERALTLDPSLRRRVRCLAYVEGLYEWKWQAADADFTTAIRLRPNLAVPTKRMPTFNDSRGATPKRSNRLRAMDSIRSPAS